MVGAKVLLWAGLETHAVACKGPIEWQVGFVFDVAFKLCMIHGIQARALAVGMGNDEWEAYAWIGGVYALLPERPGAGHRFSIAP